jgi:AmmeMemoRadiSam system protein B
LARALEEAAYRTVWEDIRFPPVSAVELDHLEIEVWVLADPERALASGEDRAQIVKIGTHGLVIERGPSRGLLLPGVAVEHGWDAVRFLEQTCTKAGLHPSLWKDDDTALFTFEGDSIRGKVARSEAAGIASYPQPWFSAQELDTYANFCRHNVVALAMGLTPNYYQYGVSDGTVSGIILTVRTGDGSSENHVGQISLRPGLPLQSTLFNLSQTTAGALVQQRVSFEQLQTLHAGVTVMYNAALHGTVADCDLAGFDARTRGMLVLERSKAGFWFEPERSPEELLQIAAEQAQMRRPHAASVFSLEAVSTERRVGFSTAPRPIRGPAERQPAMAGKFYPDNPEELSRLVDQLMGEPAAPESWSAAMVPHAGLVFSGRIATSVLKRIRIPDTVIVIGPKHTPYGMDWAVAPQQTWFMPGFSVESDFKLVRRLVQAIPGLELDAMAHKQEHAIEVELPFISRLAPRARVIGIAIGSDSDFEDCMRFALGLASVLGECENRPLLVISSDMNHFATDSETRVLDELAVTSLETLDPRSVYDTMKQNEISMCGVLPAVIVLETLRLLECPARAERVAYGTSADVTGDPSRVVGYAGMLFG